MSDIRCCLLLNLSFAQAQTVILLVMLSQKFPIKRISANDVPGLPLSHCQASSQH